MLSFLLLAGLVGAVVPASFAAESGPALLIGKPAPDFTLTDLSGKEVKLSRFKGKPVFIEFWATWCKYCVEVLPGVEKIHKELSPKGLEVLAITIDTKRDAIAPFLKKNGYTMPVLLGDGKTLTLFSTKVIPTCFLIDRAGIVRKTFTNYGVKGQAQVESELEKLIAE
jgi:peroxiredoxin